MPTRERILQAALALFAERGADATSMRDIAREAGVTVPGLYYHFDSKAELIHATYESRGIDRVLYDTSDDDEGADLLARILGEGGRVIDMVLHETDFLRLYARDAVSGASDAAEVGNRLAAAWQARWKERLAGASDVAPDADLDAAADAATTYFWGLIFQVLTAAGSGVRTRREIDVRVRAFATVLADSLRRR